MSWQDMTDTPLMMSSVERHRFAAVGLEGMRQSGRHVSNGLLVGSAVDYPHARSAQWASRQISVFAMSAWTAIAWPGRVLSMSFDRAMEALYQSHNIDIYHPGP